MAQQYADNTAIKYPLDPFNEGNIPNDILIDMAMSVPSGVDVYLTNLVITSKFTFISFESDTGAAVGHLIQSYPSVGSITPITMTMDGYAWIVFGAGVLEGDKDFKNVRIKLDSTVLLPNVIADNPFSLFVDGKAYTRPDILNIIPLGYIETEETLNVLKLVRADDQLAGNDSITLFTTQEYSSRMVTYINGVPPDSSGNIDIDITHNVGSGNITEIKRASDQSVIGLLISTFGMTDCSDETERLKKKLLCRTEYGITYQLPLDHVNCPGDILCPPEVI